MKIIARKNGVYKNVKDRTSGLEKAGVGSTPGEL